MRIETDYEMRKRRRERRIAVWTIVALVLALFAYGLKSLSDEIDKDVDKLIEQENFDREMWLRYRIRVPR